MKSKTMKIFIGLIGVVVLYQGAKWGWGEASKAYFNYRCEQDAGGFIYRTVENVEGVFQMRPREQRDYITSLRNGNLLEDPYGHTDKEAQRSWDLFLPKPNERAYSFFESTQGPELKKYDLYKEIMTISERPIYTGEPYWRYTYHGLRREYKGENYWTMHEAKQVSELKSQYGFTWRQFQNNWDIVFKVYGGELIVKELATDETLGVRRGYFIYSNWPKLMGGCPKRKHHDIAFEFVSKVLIPAPFDGSNLEEKDYGY